MDETDMIRVPDDVRARFTGSLLAPGEEGYDEARRVHNGLIDKRPALVARCHTTADVVEAVRLGRRQASEISIRGGGHNVAGRSVTEGGLMIDLAPMKGIRVDPRTWRVWAQPGVTWGEYNRAAALHGLATTGGVVSSTGISGLTLGGGEGWLMGRYGLTVDNLLSAEMVTADGEVLTASAEENADLFWALRGGGGNFGVVTAFEYRAHPVSTVTGGAVVHSLRDGLAVLDFYREFTSSVPDDLTVFLGLGDPGDGSGEKLVAMPLCHCGGDLERVDSDLAPLRKFGSPMVDDVRLMPYPVINTLSDAGYPRGALNYWKSAFVRELSGELMEIMADAFERCPSP
ncbi:MAG TPA: FAD-dependent oxidoreductase, partial [Acidimicrobiia bacterium]|nr:FAD-dependent oxidoreductase [Acidimicrobiia bacterium]